VVLRLARLEERAGDGQEVRDAIEAADLDQGGVSPA